MHFLNKIRRLWGRINKSKLKRVGIRSSMYVGVTLVHFIIACATLFIVNTSMNDGLWSVHISELIFVFALSAMYATYTLNNKIRCKIFKPGKDNTMAKALLLVIFLFVYNVLTDFKVLFITIFIFTLFLFGKMLDYRMKYEIAERRAKVISDAWRDKHVKDIRSTDGQKVVGYGMKSGKTTYLLFKSHEKRMPILVANYQQVENLKRQADFLGLSIPDPLTASTVRHLPGSGTKHVLVDEVEQVIASLTGAQPETITTSYDLAMVGGRDDEAREKADSGTM